MDGYSRIYRVGTLCLAAILLLIVPSCAPGERIQTPLTPGEHVQEVELSDGYLYFVDNAQGSRIVDYAFDATIGSLTYEDVIRVLGFDLAAACAALPERLQLGPAHFQGDDVLLLDAGGVWGGYEFRRYGGSTEYANVLRPRLILRYQTRDGYLDHADAGQFRVLPWERWDPDGDAYNAKYNPAADVDYLHSRVGDIEVGVLHENTPFAIAPEAPCEFYYAGFYIGDLAFALESHCNYCTQEEFIQVLLAIIDAAVAAENGTQTATQEG